MAVTVNRPLDAGLVLHLTMSEGSGSKAWDRSPYQNHGAISGATWTNGPSGKGKALLFNGTASDYVDLGTHSELELQNFSVCMWMKASEYNNRGLFYGGLYSANKGVGIYSVNATGGLRLWVGNGTTKYYAFNGNPIEVDEDVFVAVTKSGVNAKLYYNGRIVQSQALDDGTIDYSAGSIRYIGMGLINYYHNGMIDEFRLYNRILSMGEICQLYMMRGRV